MAHSSNSLEVIARFVQGSAGVPFVSQYLTISSNTPRPQIPWLAQSKISHELLRILKQDRELLTLDPQFQGRWIDGLGIGAVDRSHWNRGSLDTVAFERASNLTPQGRGGKCPRTCYSTRRGSRSRNVSVHPTVNQIGYSVHRRKTGGGRIRINVVQVKLNDIRERRRTKNSVSSRNAWLSYLWIRWDS